MRKKSKYTIGLLAAFILTGIQPAWAAGPPPPSIFNNTLAVSLITLMLLLLIVIGILGNILIGSADYKNRKNKMEANSSAGKNITSALLALSLLSAPAVFAQDAGSTTTAQATDTIGGMAASTFYVMASVLLIEVLVILTLLINIKFLLKKEQDRLISAAEMEVIKRNRLTWWDKVNKLRPVSQEAELDLGHEYDGIRELNNRLPPWWLYGFYATILFAGVYLWRYHVSHTGPSSKQEYERSVAAADIRIKEYLKQKGDAVDENTVTMLTAPEDLAAGKKIFTISCASCHKESGAGDVGPNLTDDYWLHGNNIKDIFKTIRYGINAMPQWQHMYSNKEIAQVASYVKSLHGTNPPNPKTPQGTLQKEEPLTVPATDSAAAEKKLAVNQ